MTGNYTEYQSISSSSFSSNDINERPKFVDAERLKKIYCCAICNDVVVQPHQTPCGNRVCKECMNEKFDNLSVIKCPLPHDITGEELKEEQCQQEGLSIDAVVPDSACQRFLLKEKCFCENQKFGCPEKPLWKELEGHQATCVYIPSQCPNQDCTQSVAKKDLESHLTNCEYALDTCHVCKRTFKHKDKELMIHQKTNPECLRTPGKCYYFEYCSFQSDNLNELKAHMENNTQSHIEAITVQVDKLRSLCESVRKAPITDENKKNEKIKNLEKCLARHHLQLKALTDAAKPVSQRCDGLESRLSEVERRVEEFSIDRRAQYEHSLKETFQRMDKVENSMKTVELCSYDGVLVWKINDYKRRKIDAVRGRQMSIYSHPFYTSRHGYKMCCCAYLNGDGLDRGKCLSLFFVLMKGEYDELLHFPFKQRVTFSLLCSSNPSLSKHETFLPDPDSSSFRRPQTEMNIASGCPQFALHADVESSNFLVNDCIYVQVRVEPGGEKFPKEKRNTELF